MVVLRVIWAQDAAPAARSNFCSPGGLWPLGRTMMGDRFDAACAANVAKRVYGRDLHDALDAIEKVGKEKPKQARLAQKLVEACPGSAPGQRSTGAKPDDEGASTFRSLARLPGVAVQIMLLNSAQSLTLKQSLWWKLQDSQVQIHLFEAEFGLDPAKPWPAAGGHSGAILEPILFAWKSDCYGGGLFEKWPLLTQARRLDWNVDGVYHLLPEEKNEKEEVLHKPTGEIAIIPESMRVDASWRFKSNWSGKHAELVDAEGYGRKVSTMFDAAMFSDEVWLDFLGKAICQRMAPTCPSAPAGVFQRLGGVLSPEDPADEPDLVTPPPNTKKKKRRNGETGSPPLACPLPNFDE